MADGFAVLLPGTTPLVGASNIGLADDVAGPTSHIRRFKLWGTVKTLDADRFQLDDGSKRPVTIYAAGYTGITDGDYASAVGTLDTSTTPVTLISSAAQVSKLNP